MLSHESLRFGRVAFGLCLFRNLLLAFVEVEEGVKLVLSDHQFLQLRLMLERLVRLFLKIPQCFLELLDVILWDPLESTCRHASLSIL